ncbi:uncharacterized protein LOC117169672 isoform X1 [Belonocnema kinseyi]|uniref:uncharacterized protein LOC117169672 isoform X1 n=1 Tax=Belonocnema kinseyi TaxID=2817044 RepID=UPI00143CC784|nr:uncharacterized protein LOC117169672 isoform X1 [Belonocnema kinseyi]
MRAEKNRRPSIDDASAMELLQLQEAAKIASIYHKGDLEFTRNTNLTHVVHATLNIVQFITALMDEIFHHLHHAIHHHRQKQDPTLADLPEERNPIFFVYPLCMVISFILAILWLFTKLLNRYSIIAPVGCAIGGFLMFLGGIFSMRHAEKHINLNEVSDEELINHPIFIHNFILCVISIFGMIIYSIQFWILYDFWRLEKLKQEPTLESSNPESDQSTFTSESNSDESQISDKSEEKDDREKMESVGHPHPIPELDSLSLRSVTVKENPNDEPAILYCCLVDCYNYVKIAYGTQKPNHEFQVIHVM